MYSFRDPEPGPVLGLFTANCGPFPRFWAAFLQSMFTPYCFQFHVANQGELPLSRFLRPWSPPSLGELWDQWGCVLCHRLHSYQQWMVWWDYSILNTTPKDKILTSFYGGVPVGRNGLQKWWPTVPCSPVCTRCSSHLKVTLFSFLWICSLLWPIGYSIGGARWLTLGLRHLWFPFSHLGASYDVKFEYLTAEKRIKRGGSGEAGRGGSRL
jgi:hypothetical protein